MATGTVEKILAEKLPALELVEPTTAPAGVDQLITSSHPGPSLAALRAKYLGHAADSNSVRPAPTEHIEVRQARSRKGSPIGNRTLIFSSEKGLIGSQG